MSVRNVNFQKRIKDELFLRRFRTFCQKTNKKLKYFFSETEFRMLRLQNTILNE